MTASNSDHGSSPSPPLHRPRWTRVQGWWHGLPGNIRGAFWMSGAAIFFAVMAALIKTIGQNIPVAQMLFLRQTVIAVLLLPAIARTFPQHLKTRNPGLHALRVLFALLAMGFGFTAVVHLPLADATAIGFAKAFFLTIFAIIFLKEVVGLRRWLATIVGFVGIVIMIKPSGDAVNIYGVMAILGAAAAGMAITIIRRLAQMESTSTILTFQTVFIGLLTLPIALYTWVTPSLLEWGLILALGLVSYIAQYANVRAYRDGEPTAIASIDYTRLLYATLIGGFLFAQWPQTETYVGAALIIAASLYTLHREARIGRSITRSGTGRGMTN